MPIPGTLHRPHTRLGDLQPGDIVQIDPERASNHAFNACLGVVERVEAWGAMVVVVVPDRGHSACAPYRAKYEEMVKVGHAEWHIR